MEKISFGKNLFKIYNTLRISNMNESLKATEVEREGSHSFSPEKSRGMFFGAALEKEVLSIKTELAHQTNYGIECAKEEYAVIMQLFNKKISEPQGEPSFSENLADYPEKIKFLYELTCIFERIERYCDFVTEGLLPFMTSALEKIRLAYGCDLNDHTTWKIAQDATKTLSRNTTTLDISRSHLRSLYDHVYDEMEWFSMSYNAADLESKERFFSELRKTPELLAWAQPWIEIAEGKEADCETALAKSMKVISNAQNLVTQQVH
jgi:hypothetical protein